MLPGLMMDYPLTLTHFLERARSFFGKREIVSRLPDGTLHRYTYSDYYERTCQLAHALRRLGVGPGDRVATLCWNHHRHFEAYFAVPGIGAVLHTLNLRLHPSELEYIANHAGDKIILVDRSLLPLLSEFRDALGALKKVIVIPDDGPTPPDELDYESILSSEAPDFAWPTLDEKSAALMCYTSGTTGLPKGVLYSHRSTALHTLMLCMVDTKGVCEADAVLPVVPMFHANAWGLPFAAAAVGAKLVFPGPDLKPRSILDLMEQERVSLAAGVPTVWLGALALLDESPKNWDLSAVRMISVGGAAAPQSLLAGMDRHGLDMRQGWGMTETNPLAAVCRLKEGISRGDDSDLERRAKQGFATVLVEQRHIGDDGQVLPWDGEQMGELEVRGPWVARAYYESEEGADKFTEDGWFRTGDIVTIDPEGYVHITDRAKDVIKSGGEWISTQALENALMSHEAVLEAAVFAARHDKWGERPVAAVVLKPGRQVTKDELTAKLQGQFANWWLPDDYLFLDEVPKTSTGKFKKRELRDRYGNHLVG